MCQQNKNKVAAIVSKLNIKIMQLFPITLIDTSKYCGNNVKFDANYKKFIEKKNAE